eukprot:TRINITY_DN15034_c0_g1_i1.p1 TRINITY_DN15034_c0_g1~~TRINITY_DN15034_c0_g1_i1.p1  ORF type:complete len:1370 (+),score=544.79 TRINITY_DN15034_c0_g1_i1:99-4208(+)
MAYLSTVSDSHVGRKHLRQLSPDQRARLYADPQEQLKLIKDRPTDQVAPRLQVIQEFQFEGKIRALAHADPTQPLHKLRVWTAEQDGSVFVRKASTGARVNTIEKKDGCFVTAICHHRIEGEDTYDGLAQDNMYVGYSDGFLRVYRSKTHRKIQLPRTKSKLAGFKFEAGGCKIRTIAPNSPAEVAGFMEGMTVESINGEPVNSAREIMEKIDAQTAPCELVVDVRRQVGEGELECDYDLVANVKKHTKEITCMLVMEGDILVTGGRDWQIYLWRWEARRRVPPDASASAAITGTLWSKADFEDRDDLGCTWAEAIPGTEKFKAFDQFSGAQNAVTALCYRPGLDAYMGDHGGDGSGGLLYSGGDDFVIRCLDLKSGHERTVSRGFPIIASGKHGGHREGIKALAANHRYLFSSSKDGTVRVWDAESGFPVGLGGTSDNCLYGRIPPQGFEMPRRDPQLCLLMMTHDAAREQGHLFSAGMDGVLRVWDAFGDPHGMYELQPPEGQEGPVWGYTDEGLSELARDKEPLARGDLVGVAEIGKGGRDWMRLADGRYVDKRWLLPRDPKDTGGCHQAWLTDEKLEHVGSIIQNLGLVQGHVHGRVTWAAVPDATGEANTVRVYYSESDAAEPKDVAAHEQGMSSGERRLTKEIEDLRGEVLSNAAELDALRRQKGKLEEKDKSRRACLASKFHGQYERSVKEFYWVKLMQWRRWARSMQRRREMAGLLLRTSAEGLRQVYYSKLRGYARVSRDRRRRNKLSQALLATNDKGLQVLYWHHLCNYAKRHAAAKKRRDIANALMMNTARGRMYVYFTRWMRWRSSRAQAKKRQAIAFALMGKSDNGLKVIYYHKLIHNYKRWKQDRHRRTLSSTFAMFSDKNRMLDCYAKWARWSRLNKSKRKRRDYAAVLARGSDHVLVHIYNQRCMQWVTARRKAELARKLKELDEQFRRLDELLEGTSDMTDAEIAAEQEKLEREIEQLEQDIERLRRLIAEQAEANGELEREIANTMTEKPTGDETERLAWLMRRLKAHGCNCKYDQNEIQAAKKEWAKEWAFRAADRATPEALSHPRAPKKHVENALTTIRVALQDSFDQLASIRHWRTEMRPQAGRPWAMNMAVVHHMTGDRKLFQRCHAGVARLVIAWDRITSREKQIIYGQKFEKGDLKAADPAAQEPGTVEYTERRVLESVDPAVKKEIDDNIMWILTICTLMYERRMEGETHAQQLAMEQARKEAELSESFHGGHSLSVSQRGASPKRDEPPTPTFDSGAAAPAASGGAVRARRVGARPAGGSIARSGGQSAPSAPSAGSSHRRPPPQAGSSAQSAPKSPTGGGGSSQRRAAPGSPADGSSKRAAAPAKPAAKPGSSSRRPPPTKT